MGESINSIERVRLAAAVTLLVGGAGVAYARSAGLFGGLKTAPAVVVQAAPIRLISDTLRSGETLSQLFARQGVNNVDWGMVAAAVRNFDPSRMRSGMVFNFSQRQGEAEPNAVTVRASYDTRLHLVRAMDTGEWTPSVETIAWKTEDFLVSGV